MKKILSSLPVRLIIGVVIGIIIGLGSADLWIGGTDVGGTIMQVVLTLKNLLGSLINFCVPLIIIGFIAPSITRLRSNASRMLVLALALAYTSSVCAALMSMGAGYAIIPGLSIQSAAEGLREAPELLFNLDIAPVMSVMSALVFSVLVGLAATWTRAKVITQVLEEFQRVVEAVHAAGFETGVIHAAGSSALMNYEFARLDAVRVASAFLGRCRRTRGDGLQKVGYGEATLEEIRWLPKGHTVGNSRLITMKKPTRVAVLPVGYQNGFGAQRPRESGLAALLRYWWGSRRQSVHIGDQRARVIGQIGALETLVDVTELKCKPGDIAVFDLDPLYARGMKREYR